MSVIFKIGQQDFTVTIATPAVFSATAHGLIAGDIIYLSTTGALPTGLAEDTAYYVIATGLTADAFRLSATLGGSAINTSGSQSGTHTLAIDRTINVEYNSVNIQRAMTSQVDTVKFNVVRQGGVVGAGYKPEILDVVKIMDGTQVIFGGQIVSIDETVNASAIETFSCTCKDFSYDMDRTLVVGNYEGETIEDIISAIATDFLSAEYDITNVSCPIIANYIAFNYEYPSKCFQQLADLVNYDWYVDEDKKIYFFEKSTFPSPFDLTDTSGNYYYNTLILKNNLTSLRNTIIVRGGQYLGTLTSENEVADGETTTFKQGYQYNSVFVKLDGVSQTVGIANIDNPAGFDCLYNFQEKFVLFPSAVTISTVVEVGGLPYIPVIVKVADSASVVAYGTREFKIIDKSINSKEGARDRAKAEIAVWSQTINEGSFDTMTAGLDVGQQINIQSDIRGVDTDYVISRINTTMVNGTQFLHKITLVTTKTYGMIEFLMSLLMAKDKEIVINEGEVLDEVENADEAITVDDGTVVVAITHNPQTETITTGESSTVQALDYAVEFAIGEQAPSGVSRQFVLDGSPLA